MNGGGGGLVIAGSLLIDFLLFFVRIRPCAGTGDPRIRGRPC